MNPHTQRTFFDTRRMIIVTGAAAGAVTILAAAILVGFLVHTVATTTIPFDTDEANHAMDGWEVYHAIAHVDPAGLLRAVAGQSFYPPLHSFFVAAAYLTAGPGRASSRMPSVIVFAAVLCSVAWLTCRLLQLEDADTRHGGPWLPAIGAALAVGFAVTSPAFITSAVLCMLEVTGSMFACIVIMAACWADRSTCRQSRMISLSMTALAAAMLFLTKYSFGLFYGPALIAALLLRRHKDAPRARLEAAVTGGIYLAVLLLWLCVTDRRTMLMFFTAHPGYVPFWSVENLLFYPQAWLKEYSSSPLTGMVAFVFAAAGAVRYWRYLAVRLCAWSVLIALGVLTLSTTNETRHMYVVAPAIWLLAGLGLVHVLRRLIILPRGHACVTGAVVLLWSCLLVSAVKPALALRARLNDAFEGLPVYAKLQEFALQHADLDKPVLLVGFRNDQYRLQAIRWQAAVLSGKSVWDLDIDCFPFDDRQYSLRRTNRKPQKFFPDDHSPERQLTAVLESGYYATVIETLRVFSTGETASRMPWHQRLRDVPCVTKRFDQWVVRVCVLGDGTK